MQNELLILKLLYFVAAPVLSLLLSLALVPLFKKLAIRYHLYDYPDKGGPIQRKIHSNPTPRIGGLALISAFLITFFIYGGFSGDLVYIILPSVAIFAIGFLDDIYTLSAKIRLLFQIGVALWGTIASGLYLTKIVLLPDFYLIIPPWLGVIFSVFIIVGAINAVNMVDGMDGLAGGLILIAASLITAVHYQINNNTNIIIYFFLPLTGALLGFLRYNSHPASIFMGDGGSNWLGYITGVLMLLLATNANITEQNGLNQLSVSPVQYPAPLLSVVLCMAIPILDTAFVIYSRLRQGKKVTTADNLHLHHGLLKIGLKNPEVVSSIYFLAMIVGISGIYPVVYTKYNLYIWAYLTPVLVILILYLIFRLEKSVAFLTPLYQVITRHRKYRQLQTLQNLTRYWERSNRYLIVTLILLTPFFAGDSGKTLGLIAGLMLLFLSITFLIPWEKAGFIDSLILSLGIMIILFVNNQDQLIISLNDQEYNIQYIYNTIFILLGASLTLFIGFTFRKNYLVVAPTDFLVLLLPILLFFVPYEYHQKYYLTMIGLRSLVLLMGVRVLVRRHKDFFYRIKVITLIALTYIFLNGFLNIRLF